MRITNYACLVALLLAFCSVAADDKPQYATQEKQPFSRLFTQADERKRLDERRAAYGFSSAEDNSDKKVEVQQDASSNHVAYVARPLIFSGIIMRADGKQQIWVNGQQQLGVDTLKNNINKNLLPMSSRNQGYQPANLQKNSSANLKIPFLTQQQYRLLKPGQVWIPNSKKTTEAYLLPNTTAAVEPAKNSSSETTEQINSAEIIHVTDEGANTKEP
jgi:hypothetical protein